MRVVRESFDNDLLESRNDWQESESDLLESDLHESCTREVVMYKRVIAFCLRVVRKRVFSHSCEREFLF